MEFDLRAILPPITEKSCSPECPEGTVIIVNKSASTQAEGIKASYTELSTFKEPLEGDSAIVRETSLLPPSLGSVLPPLFPPGHSQEDELSML